MSYSAADMSGENYTVIAAALKLYLRDLNDPIVPTILFDKIAAALSKYFREACHRGSDLTKNRTCRSG